MLQFVSHTMGDTTTTPIPGKKITFLSESIIKSENRGLSKANDRKIGTSVADPGCLSRIWIRIFPIPDPGSKIFPDPRSGSASEELKYFKIVSTLSVDFLSIPDLGSRAQKGTGSRIRTHNTNLHTDKTCTVRKFFLGELEPYGSSLFR
jgi:hypothetical protein